MVDFKLQKALVRTVGAVLIVACMAPSDLAARSALVSKTAHTTGGLVQIAWNRSHLANFGIRISSDQSAHRAADFADWTMTPHAHLTAVVRGDAVFKLVSANLPVRGGFTIHTAAGKLEVHGFTLRYRKGPQPTLDLVNGNGHRLFHADHLMLEYDRRVHAVRISAMDIRLSPWLAQHMAKPQLAGQLVGAGRIAAPIPQTSSHRETADCPSSHRWPGASVPDHAGDTYQVDVFMEALIA